MLRVSIQPPLWAFSPCSPLLAFMRLGVFLPNWIGDVVMATPALRALRKHVGQHGQLIGIMRPYVADVLAGLPWFDETITYTPGGIWRSAKPQAVRALRGARLDAVMLLTNSLRTAWLAWRSGARRRVGYVGDFRSWLLTDRLALPRRRDSTAPVPPIDAYLHLARSIGCPSEPPLMELATTPADEQMAGDVWRRLGLPPGERVIILNSGGAYGAAKHWPAEHFAALACRIVADGAFSVLVNCGPAERDIALEIASRAADRRVVALANARESNDFPIGLTKACIRRSRMLVTTDSGPRFFAAAFGKPVVTLFGPTSPAATSTHYRGETSLALSLDCQPCMARTCRLGHHRCLRELSVDRVFAAVVERLQADFPLRETG